jgi:hypothetical protein
MIVGAVLDFILNGTTEVVSLTLSDPSGNTGKNGSEIAPFPLTRFDAIIGLVEYGGACNIDDNRESFFFIYFLYFFFVNFYC